MTGRLHTHCLETMRGSSNRDRKMKKKEKDKGEEQVEELLQAAQDQVLLNLSLNSHIARAPPTQSSISISSDDVGIHLDLERRFQALKTKSPAAATQQQQQQQHNNDQELRSVLGNDLSARFATLKAKSSSSSTVGLGLTGTGAAAAAAPSRALYDEESEDEEEQVRKLIDWAKDAARLDPSPPSDDEEEDDHHDDDNQDHDEDSSASDQDINRTPRKRK